MNSRVANLSSYILHITGWKQVVLDGRVVADNVTTVLDTDMHKYSRVRIVCTPALQLYTYVRNPRLQ